MTMRSGDTRVYTRTAYYSDEHTGMPEEPAEVPSIVTNDNAPSLLELVLARGVAEGL